MIAEIIIMGLLGLFFGLILAYLSKKFRVEKDPRIEQVRKLLPGVNCGACGLASCDAFAEAVVKGEVPIDACIPGRKTYAPKIRELLGK